MPPTSKNNNPVAAAAHETTAHSRLLLPKPIAVLLVLFCTGMGSVYFFGTLHAKPTFSTAAALVASSSPTLPYTQIALADTAPATTTATTTETFSYDLRVAGVSADKYLVADVDTGTVLASKNAYDQAPIASLTKLVTALAVDDHFDLDKPVVVPQAAIVYTTVPRLKAGETLRASDLLFLLLQESSNEAAEALAASVGRDEFVGYMNDEIKQIGLAHTSLNDPSGVSNDMSTAQDLFALLRYINLHHNSIFDVTIGKSTNSTFGYLNDFNLLKGVSTPLIGGKVGQTNKAGETYAGIFSVSIGGQNRHIAVIVLGSTSDASDVKKLLAFVKASYAPAD
jgi:D-alanyl-D-alanine carboxypeptidase